MADIDYRLKIGAPLASSIIVCCQQAVAPWQLLSGTLSTTWHKSTSNTCSNWTSNTNTDDASLFHGCADVTGLCCPT